MDDETYNGYSNFATWQTCLVLDNNSDAYFYLRQIKRIMPFSEFCYAVQFFCEHNKQSIFYYEDINWPDVNWYQIALEIWRE